MSTRYRREGWDLAERVFPKGYFRGTVDNPPLSTGNIAGVALGSEWVDAQGYERRAYVVPMEGTDHPAVMAAVVARMLRENHADAAPAEHRLWMARHHLGSMGGAVFPLPGAPGHCVCGCGRPAAAGRAFHAEGVDHV